MFFRLLFAALLGAMMGLGAGSTRDQILSSFASAKECKSCHEDIFEQWESSLHSKAAVNPVFWKLFHHAVEREDDRVSAICLTCHAPVASAGKEIKWWGPVSLPVELSSIAQEGVTCNFCHTISGHENRGKNVSVAVGAYRVSRKAETGRKYGPFPDASSPEHGTGECSLLEDSRLCRICHNDEHPLFGKGVEDTHSEWYASSYRQEGQKCQDCHMPATAGRAATKGPERPALKVHIFRGSQVEMLRKAAVVDMSAKVKGSAERKRGLLDVTVSNTGSGHTLPHGLPGLRQMWLEVAVTSKDGTQLFSDRTSFEAHLIDGDGNPALPWTAVRVDRDTRIAPKKSRRTTFRFDLPAGKPLELEAVAKLFYQRISEEAAQRDGIEATPPIEVASKKISMSP